MSEEVEIGSAQWIYERLRPYISRMPRGGAFDALEESVELGHLEVEQVESIVRLWAEDVAHLPHSKE